MKKKCSRILSLLMTLAMLLGILPTAAFAVAPTMTMHVSTPSALPGTTTQVKIDLENNSGVASIMIEVAFDPALTLTKIEVNSSELGGMHQLPQKYESPFRLGWFNGMANFEGENANFAILTFDVAEDAMTDHLYPLTVTYDPENIYNIKEENIDLTLINGGVQVVACTPGDINDDGSVNMKDITRLFQYLGGWEVTTNQSVMDTNGDGSVNMKDLSRLFQYLGGWEVELHPVVQPCNHVMNHVDYTAPTCTEPGKSAHWHCTKCNKNYSDEMGNSLISDKALVLPALGHELEIIPAVKPTTEKEGWTEGKRCKRCGIVTEAPVRIPPLEVTEFNIIYDLYDNDSYLQSVGVENPNPNKFSSEKGLKLLPLRAPGYRFLGWFNGYGDPVREIPVGTKNDVYLSARWEVAGGYTVHFVSEGKPIEVKDEAGHMVSSITKSTNELLLLPEPEMQGYIFLCWTDRDNNIVTSINPGSSGNKTLYAHWTSVRNQAVPKKMEKPLIYEDIEHGQILFTYPIGDIINVPLTELANYGNQLGAGLTWEVETEQTYTVTKDQAKTIGDCIADTTSRSAAWTLSDSWSKDVACDVTHQDSITKEQAQTIKDRVDKGEQWNVSTENGGSSSFSKTSGSSSGQTTGQTTASLKEFSESENHSSSNTDSGQFEAGIAGKVTNNTTVKASAEVSAKYGPFGAKAGVEATNSTGFEVNSHADYAHQWSSSQDDDWSASAHNSDALGTNNTQVSSSYSNSTENQQATWNSQRGYAKSHEISNEKSVSNALTNMIADQYHQGTTIGEDKTSSATTNETTEATKSRETSTTVGYATEQRETVRKKVTNAGAAEGWYRVVEAGTVHVYAVVGFDIATGSYYTYSYNIVDAKDRHEFFDYSNVNGKFNDRENGVLPFAVPEEVHEIVSDIMMRTQGLKINTSTGVIEEYTGDSQAVVVPDYVTVDRGGVPVAVQVTGIASGAFQGNTNVKAIKLGRYVKDIPANAFRNCTGLETLVAPGMRTIGDNAFAGCTALKDFSINTQITKMGVNAFGGINKLTVRAANTQVAEAALASGAKNIDVSIDQMSDSFYAGQELRTLTVPSGTTSFALHGDAKSKTTLENTKLVSYAAKTTLDNLSFKTNGATVLELDSPAVKLGYTDVQTDAIALLLKNLNTTVQVSDISNLTSTGACSMLTRNAAYEAAGVGTTNMIKASAGVKVCGTHTDPQGLVIGSIEHITEDQYNGILSTHRLILNPTSGTVSPTELNVEYGRPMGTLPTPVREHYEFVGWFTEETGGKQITADTVCNFMGDQTIYAHWVLREYSLTYEVPTGVDIYVERTSSAKQGAALGKLNSGAVVYNGDELHVTYTAQEGYELNSQGKSNIRVSGNVGSSDIYAAARVKSFTASWNVEEGSVISVKRTSSPLQGASTGSLSSGSTVYYGDVLDMWYDAEPGYSLNSHGYGGHTVRGNVTSNEIYAHVTPNEYTYQIRYQSTNGTNLGSSSATYRYGTTNTITAPGKSGYNTPSAQNVKWDSTSSKTIVFRYSPSSVSNDTQYGTVSPRISGKQPGITYAADVELGARGSDFIDIRISATNTIHAHSFTVYGQKLVATCNGVSSGEVTIAPFNTWKNETSSSRSSSGRSGWMRIPVNTTNATSISINAYFYQTNSKNTDMTKYYDVPGTNDTWYINIPAY